MAIQVKGAVLQSRQAFVTEVFGEDAWQRVLAALPTGERQELEGSVLASTWHSFELNEHLDAAIVETVGKGDATIFEQIGRWSAKKNLTGPHKAFAGRRDAQRFMVATDRIYDLYYDTGRRTWEQTGPTSGVMTTYEAETFSKTDCLTIIGWHKEALEMCGATNVTIVEEQCRARGDEVCRYALSWEQ